METDISMSDDILMRLSDIIKARKSSSSESSYTKSLLERGPEFISKKIGEEATEVVIALCSQNDEAVKREVADLLYHLLVGLEYRNLKLSEIYRELEGRIGRSGHEEKASRPKETARRTEND